MKKKTVISIAQDFSKTPAGRFQKDGRYSGENFRKQKLEPLFNENGFDGVEIDLTGLEGVGSSFWEEAFAGFMREHSEKKQEIFDKITFICKDDASLEPLIHSYMQEELNRKDE